MTTKATDGTRLSHDPDGILHTRMLGCDADYTKCQRDLYEVPTRILHHDDGDDDDEAPESVIRIQIGPR